jgi:hypothetical protein
MYQKTNSSRTKNNFLKSYSCKPINHDLHGPTVLYTLAKDAVFQPKICPQSNGLDIPFQHKVTLQPNELKKST